MNAGQHSSAKGAAKRTSHFVNGRASEPLVILSITRRGRGVRVLALTEACKKHVSPFLRKLAKLPPLNLQDTPYLALFLTQSRLRSRRVIPVLQRVLISLGRSGRFPAVHPAAAVFHRCRLARLSGALRSSPAARAQMHREFALHGVEHHRGDRSGRGSARNPK